LFSTIFLHKFSFPVLLCYSSHCLVTDLHYSVQLMDFRKIYTHMLVCLDCRLSLISPWRRSRERGDFFFRQEIFQNFWVESRCRRLSHESRDSRMIVECYKSQPICDSNVARKKCRTTRHIQSTTLITIFLHITRHL